MKNWNELSIRDKNDIIRVAVQNGITTLSDIRERYNEFAEGGPTISDEEYQGRMRQVAEENWRNWGYESAEEAYRDQINNPTYDYRSFYANNPDATNNANTHWPDTYKGALHPTFSNESVYDGRINSVFNPSGIKGGRWNENGYIPHGSSFTVPNALIENAFAKGGNLYWDGGVQQADNTNVDLGIVPNLPMDDSTTSTITRNYMLDKRAMTDEERAAQDWYLRATQQGPYQWRVGPTDEVARRGYIEVDPKTGDIVGYTAPTTVSAAPLTEGERMWQSPAFQLALAPMLDAPFMLNAVNKLKYPGLTALKEMANPRTPVNVEGVYSGISPYIERVSGNNRSVIGGLNFFERPASKISSSERLGIPRGERVPVRHSEPELPYVDYSLINRHYEPWTIDETGHFILDSPEKSKKLSTLHFSFNAPVTAHSGGSWNNAPSTLLIPYRNVRSQAAPVDMAIFDTFFPNYNGMKISTKGAKALTGNRATFDYYKSRGLDVEFSPEMESLLDELNGWQQKLDDLPLERRGALVGEYPEVDALRNKVTEIEDKIDKISRDWTLKHRKPIPNYEEVNKLGKAEGYDTDNYPFMFASPAREGGFGGFDGLNYHWQSDPSNHGAILQAPDYLLRHLDKDTTRPEYINYLKWLVNHKADYRALGGPLIEAVNKFKSGGGIHIKPSKRGTFTAAASKHGMGVQEFASKVLSHKENYSPAMVKKANFARNASKWHGLGGHLYDGESENTQQMDVVNSYPMSLHDYIAQRIQDTRDSAVNVMNTREYPRVYYNSSPDYIAKYINDKKASIKKIENNIIKGYESLYRDGVAKKKDSNLYTFYHNYIENERGFLQGYQNDIDSALEHGKAPEGATCIFTVTDSYGNKRAVPGNLSWLAKGKSGRPIYEEKGFQLLKPTDTLIQGDIIQQVEMGIPDHSMMYMGEREQDYSYPGSNGRFVDATYSNGAYDEYAMKRNEPMLYVPGNDNAFRFVGNAADSARWTNEYNELMRNGPLVEYAMGGRFNRK